MANQSIDGPKMGTSKCHVAKLPSSEKDLVVRSTHLHVEVKSATIWSVLSHAIGGNSCVLN